MESVAAGKGHREAPGQRRRFCGNESSPLEVIRELGWERLEAVCSLWILCLLILSWFIRWYVCSWLRPLRIALKDQTNSLCSLITFVPIERVPALKGSLSGGNVHTVSSKGNVEGWWPAVEHTVSFVSQRSSFLPLLFPIYKAYRNRILTEPL